MNIQFIRLEADVCERMNQLALEQRRTVSELVNEILRSELAQLDVLPADGSPSR